LTRKAPYKPAPAKAGDRAIRSKQENRLLADLEKLGQRVAGGKLKRIEKIGEAIGRLKERYPRVARYYELAVDPDTGQFSATLKEDKRADAALLDGCYLLKTDRDDLSADDFWLRAPHPCRGRLPRHENPARRAADLPPARAARR